MFAREDIQSRLWTLEEEGVGKPRRSSGAICGFNMSVQLWFP